MLAQRGLNDPYTGGLNAYGLCILLVAFLEFKNLEKEKDHSKIFFGFLDFLCHEFNSFQQVVNLGYHCVNVKEPFQSRGCYRKTDNLVIIDPTSVLGVNVTSNCLLFNKVIDIFLLQQKFFKQMKQELVHKIQPRVLNCYESDIDKEVQEIIDPFSSEEIFFKLFETHFAFN